MRLVKLLIFAACLGIAIWIGIVYAGAMRAGGM